MPASTSAQSWGPDDILARASVLASTSARLGVGRLFGLAGYGSLPPQSADEVRAKIATSTSLRSTIDEFLQATASEHEAASLTDFGDKPLVVLTAGSGSDAAWMAAQNQDGHPVDQQRAPRSRRSHPPRPDPEAGKTLP